jgi:hypothetical protein
MTVSFASLEGTPFAHACEHSSQSPATQRQQRQRQVMTPPHRECPRTTAASPHAAHAWPSRRRRCSDTASRGSCHARGRHRADRRRRRSLRLTRYSASGSRVPAPAAERAAVGAAAFRRVAFAIRGRAAVTAGPAEDAVGLEGALAAIGALAFGEASVFPGLPGHGSFASSRSSSQSPRSHAPQNAI